VKKLYNVMLIGLLTNVKKTALYNSVNGNGSKNRKNHKKAMLTTLTLTFRLC